MTAESMFSSLLACHLPTHLSVSTVIQDTFLPRTPLLQTFLGPFFQPLRR